MDSTNELSSLYRSSLTLDQRNAQSLPRLRTGHAFPLSRFLIQKWLAPLQRLCICISLCFLPLAICKQCHHQALDLEPFLSFRVSVRIVSRLAIAAQTKYCGGLTSKLRAAFPTNCVHSMPSPRLLSLVPRSAGQSREASPVRAICTSPCALVRPAHCIASVLYFVLAKTSSSLIRCNACTDTEKS